MGADASQINTILLMLLTGGVGVIMRQLSVIRDQTQKTNGRVTALETWKHGHENWQSERNATNEREHGQLHERITQTSKSVHDLRNETFALRLRDLHNLRNREEEG